MQMRKFLFDLLIILLTSASVAFFVRAKKAEDALEHERKLMTATMNICGEAILADPRIPNVKLQEGK